MSQLLPGLERWGVNALLLLCGICCLLITQSTSDLRQANTRRLEQLQLLGYLLTSPDAVPPGPIAGLDGLFARRLARITTAYGPAIVFVEESSLAELR